MRERLRSRFAWVDKQLAGKDYLMGSFSVADAYLYTVSRWGQFVGVDTSGLAEPASLQSNAWKHALACRQLSRPKA